MIRVATDSTRTELQHLIESAKATARKNSFEWPYITDASQYNMHSVRVRVVFRAGRNGIPTYFATLFIDGKRYGFNAAVYFIERA